MTITDRVAVVVATRNRRDSLAATLQRLAGLPERPAVVVVDNGSDDGTPDMVAADFPGVRVIALAQNLGSAARTVAARALRQPYIAFADDDSWWAAGALSRAAAAFDRHPRLALLNARILVGPDGRVDPTCVQMADSPLPREPDLPGPSLLGFVACGAVVRRDAFLAVGGFRAGFDVGGEETLLALDLAESGWGLAYVDDVVAHHDPAPSRSSRDRRRRELRNGLYTAVLRLPGRHVAARLATCAGRAVTDGAARGALAEVARELPWALANRRRVGAHVVQAYQSLR